MVPQPATSVEACDLAPTASATSGPVAAAAAPGARWPQGAHAVTGAKELRPVASKGNAWGAQGKSRKGQKDNVPSSQAVTGQIQQLKEMGFSEQQAREALAECVWDVNKALDLLFTRGVPMAAEGPDVNAAASADSKGDREAMSPTAATPVAVALTSGNNSPSGADSAEQSTTASTASSPRSSACAEKITGNSRGASVPLSPESAIDGSTGCAAVEEQEDVAEVGIPVAAADESKVVCTAPVELEVVRDAAAATKDAAQAPAQKRLTRVNKAWEMEGKDAQMCVKKGEFVNVWLSTVTEIGWIYAEDATDSERAGWLPGCVLEELPDNQCWKRAIQSMEAAHETQLSVVDGAMYKVSIDSRTKEGWIYAEANGVTTEESTDGIQAGWVPVFCLEDGADSQH